MGFKKATMEFVIDDNNRPMFSVLSNQLNALNAASQSGDFQKVLFPLTQCITAFEHIAYAIPRSAYAKRFGEDAIKQRRFYNIGGGAERYHPFWQVLDARLLTAGTGIIHILDDKTPFPLASDSAKLLYTSHCLEHLTNKTIAFTLKEMFRVLEPGQLARFVVPDTDLYHNAYVNGVNDYFINVNDNSGQYRNLSIEQNYVAQIAYPCSVLSKESPELHLSDDKIKSIFAENSKEGALDAIIAHIPENLKLSNYPHINWLNFDKLSRMIAEAGFVDIERSAFGQSKELVFCDPQTFDSTCPEISLFIEARKPAA